MNGSSMCLTPAPADIPSRMPSPSSYVEPSAMSFGLDNAGGYDATIAGFITNPPAAPHAGPGLPGHQGARAGLVPHLDAGLRDPVPQQVHHQRRAAGVPGHRD